MYVIGGYILVSHLRATLETLLETLHMWNARLYYYLALLVNAVEFIIIIILCITHCLQRSPFLADHDAISFPHAVLHM